MRDKERKEKKKRFILKLNKFVLFKGVMEIILETNDGPVCPSVSCTEVVINLPEVGSLVHAYYYTYIIYILVYVRVSVMITTTRTRTLMMMMMIA